MSELNPNTSVANQTTVARPADVQDDPLAHLHKMSTTAGLGSGDYVAISGLAVTAALVGLASTFALLSPLLLTVPVVGIVLGIIALRTIAGSNGTQSGRGLAVLGLVLSLGFAAYVGLAEVRAIMQSRAERQAISDLIEQMEKGVRAANWDETYGLFTDEFHSRFSKDEFIQQWTYLQTHPFYGGMTDIRWNGEKILFEKLPQDDALAALALLIMKFEKTQTEQTTEIYLRKKGDLWRIQSMPLFFPANQDASTAGPQ